MCASAWRKNILNHACCFHRGGGLLGAAGRGLQRAARRSLGAESHGSQSDLGGDEKEGQQGSETPPRGEVAIAAAPQMGAADPTDVFIPMLIATFCSTIVGLVVTAAVQRLRLLQPVLLAYLGGMTALVAGLVGYFSRLGEAALQAQSSVLANFLIFGVIVAFMLGGIPAVINRSDPPLWTKSLRRDEKSIRASVF